MTAMTAAVVAATVLVGWTLRRALLVPGRRPGDHRPSGAFRSWGVRSLGAGRRRLFGEDRTTDPGALLRFRTAIERGASVVQAFDAVAAGSDRWATGARRIVLRVRAGAAVQDAIDRWVAEEPDPARRLLADALSISSSTGGSHLHAVDAAIEAVRDRAALQREVRALASQAQTSAVVLVLLPIGFAATIAAADPRVRTFYVGSALGPACVAVGCALDAAGAWIMVRLVRAVA